ncbi:tRNA pseudouridine(55) synthase TruB [Legionella spiritensis]|uniref:tRNA pseudouridine synthase B n=1 Tax=Legionella spiritensis TaxID=452 RepID=A0A0W0Z6I3_LEGSP|nr:tRNA pseudouridine(55) synthase TruB [Legionella spiritensis]KTD64713.1 tRNA pseudouridine synthase B [Legionella spiritensis]SNV47997.1 tRNA pseudouridine synthase B [Legionella spiritensis]
MSKTNHQEAVNGILLVNKPQGRSSNAVLQQVKRIYSARKAGHTGSLDPLATGMLPVCFGEATKFCQYVLDSEKTYEATGLLGVKTTTSDSMGDVVSRVEHVRIDELELLAAMRQFLGSHRQIPSMYSALKHQGTPLYKYARAGIDIEREPRTIFIKELQLLSFDGLRFKIRVTCSKGTYIRNLVEDIGELLGVGAHVIQLHRLHTSDYARHEMYSPEELQGKTPEELHRYLLPMDTAVASLPHVSLEDPELVRLRQGKSVDFSNVGTDDNSSCLRLYDRAGRFVGLGWLEQSGELRVKRLLSEQALSVGSV